MRRSFYNFFREREKRIGKAKESNVSNEQEFLNHRQVLKEVNLEYLKF